MAQRHKPVRSRSKPGSWRARFSRALAQVKAAMHAHRRWLHPLGHGLRRGTRYAWYLSIAAFVLLAAVATVARLWLLPAVAERKAAVTGYLGALSGSPIEIGALYPYWDGLNPGLRAQGFRVLAPATGNVAVSLDEVRLSLDWLSLLFGQVLINDLTLVQPSLVLERLTDGRYRVAGLAAPQSPTAGANGGGFVHWLFEQRSLRVEQGELIWRDRMHNDAPLRLTNVQLSLRNDGSRHQLAITAGFPEELCGSCALQMDVQGNPLIDAEWTGRINVDTRQLHLAVLPAVVRERLPASLDGRVDLRLWTSWDGGRPQSVEGSVVVNGLVLPLPDRAEPLQLGYLSSYVQWRGQTTRWRLDMRETVAALGARRWSAGRLRADYRPGGATLQADYLDVADTAGALAPWLAPGRLRDWLLAAKPQGRLAAVQLRVFGDIDAPHGMSLDTAFQGAGALPYGALPGASGLSGRLQLGRDRGRMVLDSGSGTLALPRVFREAIPFGAAKGQVTWQEQADAWLVGVQDVDLRGRDGRLRGDLELRIARSGDVSPHIQLRADLSDGDVGQAARYYPAAMSPGVRAWLERSVRGGRLVRGHVVLDGYAADFPFRSANGRFEARAHISRASVEYMPGWAPIERAELDLLFSGSEMLVSADSGRIRNLNLSEVVVRIPDLHAEGGPELSVTGRIDGAMPALVGVLQDSPGPVWEPLRRPDLTASGDGLLTLALRVPIHDPAATALTGKLQLHDVTIGYPPLPGQFSALGGGLSFDLSGPTSGRVTGEWLGAPTTLDIDRRAVDGQPSLHLQAAGGVVWDRLPTWVGAGVDRYVGGRAGWKLDALRRAGAWRLDGGADLRDLAVTLPAPLAKRAGDEQQLAVTTRVSTPEQLVLDLSLPGRAAARLAWTWRAAGGWTLDKGRVAWGESEAALSAEPGLHLSLRAPQLLVDPWIPLYRKHIQGGDNNIVSRLSADIGSLQLLGRHYGAVGLNLAKWSSGWHGDLRGDAAAGVVAIVHGVAPNPAMLRLDLERLRIPDHDPDEVSSSAAPDPRNMPAVEVRSRDFSALGIDWGALDLAAEPGPVGWHIKQVSLTRPELDLRANGDWRIDSTGRQLTELDLRWRSRDLGRALGVLGYPGEIDGGEAAIDTRWNWAGAPTEFSLATLAGDVRLNVDKGRFLKVDPGAGRMLGLFDVSSLVRFVSLDFSSLFGRGFAFDTIAAHASVTDGDADLRALVVKGPAAEVQLSGRLGLVERDYDMRMSVTPHFGSELSVTSGLLVNPAVGAAVAVLQGLLKKPIAAGSRVEYAITGPWAQPVVTKLKAAADRNAVVSPDTGPAHD